MCKQPHPSASAASDVHMLHILRFSRRWARNLGENDVISTLTRPRGEACVHVSGFLTQPGVTTVQVALTMCWLRSNLEVTAGAQQDVRGLRANFAPLYRRDRSVRGAS